MRGDINAVELFEERNREFLTRVGYGIYDVAEGSTGGVGFEDVYRYSYLKAEDEDPKLYRRKVFNLVGRYYQNDLARALWYNFLAYQTALTDQHGYEISLEEAANKWLDQYAHAFFKEWTLRQEAVPFRMRNQPELRRGHLDGLVARLAPQWRELSESGFELLPVAVASLLESKRGYGSHYLRLVARLSGHRIRSAQEAERRQAEIEGLQHHLFQTTGVELSRREATIEYYRRLNLLAELESQPAELVGACALA
jgi:hypothetical protein